MKKPIDFHWQSSDGLRIAGRHWPVDETKAVVVLVHGLGEHCRRYDPMAVHFASHQIAMLGYDRRGHGLSEGKRGHTLGLDAFLDEIDSLLEEAKRQYPSVPCFLYGHSMGGNLVLSYYRLRRPKIYGIIASSSWIILVDEPPALLTGAVRLLHKVYPGYTQGNGLNTRHISTEPSEVEQYVEDPLVHDRISAATAVAMLDAAEALRQFKKVNDLPILLLHSEDDPIIAVESSHVLKANLSGDTELYLWKDVYHEMHNDRKRDELFEQIIEWIQRKLVNG